MKTSYRLRLAFPMMSLTGLCFGVSLIGAIGLWPFYNTAERLITLFLCLITGLSFGISASIAVDKRIDDIPWLRICTAALFILFSCGVAMARRSLVREGI